VGRPDNQDHFLVQALPEGNGWLLAVADGIGGAPQGARASRTLVEWLAAHVDGMYNAAQLEEALQTVNETLHHAGREDRRLYGMGTTVTVAQVRGGELLVAHAGDSRAYRLRGGRLERLTHDHAVAAELYEAGKITAADAATHPLRRVLTRAIGPWSAVRVDLVGSAWETGDRLLLCTDGLCGVLPDDVLASVWGASRGPAAADALIAAAVRAGTTDDVTVVLAEDDEAPVGEGGADGR
jgi:serine/threonine protein phosphatase PrpC